MSGILSFDNPYPTTDYSGDWVASANDDGECIIIVGVTNPGFTPSANIDMIIEMFGGTYTFTYSADGSLSHDKLNYAYSAQGMQGFPNTDPCVGTTIFVNPVAEPTKYPLWPVAPVAGDFDEVVKIHFVDKTGTYTDSSYLALKIKARPTSDPTCSLSTVEYWGSSEKLEAPSISISETNQVTISLPTGADKVYYTVDETTPTESSTEYTVPFQLIVADVTSVVKAVAYDSTHAKRPSAVSINSVAPEVDSSAGPFKVRGIEQLPYGAITSSSKLVINNFGNLYQISFNDLGNYIESVVSGDQSVVYDLNPVYLKGSDGNYVTVFSNFSVSTGDGSFILKSTQGYLYFKSSTSQGVSLTKEGDYYAIGNSYYIQEGSTQYRLNTTDFSYEEASFPFNFINIQVYSSKAVFILEGYDPCISDSGTLKIYNIETQQSETLEKKISFFAQLKLPMPDYFAMTYEDFSDYSEVYVTVNGGVSFNKVNIPEDWGIIPIYSGLGRYKGYYILLGFYPLSGFNENYLEKVAYLTSLDGINYSIAYEFPFNAEDAGQLAEPTWSTLYWVEGNKYSMNVQTLALNLANKAIKASIPSEFLGGSYGGVNLIGLIGNSTLILKDNESHCATVNF